MFWSTYIHTHDRLDKLRSALADAQLMMGGWKDSSSGTLISLSNTRTT